MKDQVEILNWKCASGACPRIVRREVRYSDGTKEWSRGFYAEKDHAPPRYCVTHSEAAREGERQWVEENAL